MGTVPCGGVSHRSALALHRCGQLRILPFGFLLLAKNINACHGWNLTECGHAHVIYKPPPPPPPPPPPTHIYVSLAQYTIHATRYFGPSMLRRPRGRVVSVNGPQKRCLRKVVLTFAFHWCFQRHLTYLSAEDLDEVLTL